MKGPARSPPAIRAVVRAQRALKDDPSLAAIAAKDISPRPSSLSSPISFGATRRTTMRRGRDFQGTGLGGGGAGRRGGGKGGGGG